MSNVMLHGTVTEHSVPYSRLNKSQSRDCAGAGAGGRGHRNARNFTRPHRITSALRALGVLFRSSLGLKEDFSEGPRRALGRDHDPLRFQSPLYHHSCIPYLRPSARPSVALVPISSFTRHHIDLIESKDVQTIRKHIEAGLASNDHFPDTRDTRSGIELVGR